ncbi:MAG: hypothetical protein EAZ95_01660 [Bacteroidetes bacterium]|nr:MAG: hypothetical protein EAZ95_01660 [Bacteroidota bacterium]
MITYSEEVAFLVEQIDKLDKKIASRIASDGENSLMVRQYKHLRKDFIKQLNEVMQEHGLMVQEV